MKPKVGPSAVGKCTSEDGTNQVYVVEVYAHQSQTDRTTLITEDNRAPSTLQSTFSRHRVAIFDGALVVWPEVHVI